MTATVSFAQLVKLKAQFSKAKTSPVLVENRKTALTLNRFERLLGKDYPGWRKTCFKVGDRFYLTSFQTQGRSSKPTRYLAVRI